MSKPPKQERSAKRVARMVEAYGQLLDEHGYDKVSTTMVAQRSESAIGSVYQFFANRDELAHALRDQVAAQLVTSTRAKLAASSPDNLSDCFVLLHEAMESVHRTVPGACRVPLDGLTVVRDLFEDFKAHSGFVGAGLLSLMLVGVALSAGCVKAAMEHAAFRGQILSTSQSLLIDLGKGLA